MELTHTFTVPAPLTKTWEAFNDIESVAGCFPGAAVTSVEGDDFKGTCKVKLGPISMQYTGTGTFIERDQSSGRFVLEAKGKDKRGNGTAGATVTALLSAQGEDATQVEVSTDLSITGKPAQFGRGVIQDVSDKLLGQFVACLETTVGGAAEAPAEAAAPPGAAAPAAGEAAEPAAAGAGDGKPGVTEAAAAAAAGEPGVAAAPAGARPAGAPTAGARRAERPEPEALDLGATVIPILLRSYWRQLAMVLGGFVVLVLLRKLLGRRRD